MPRYDKVLLAEQAKKYGFQASSFEKVSRLVDILRFMNETPELRDSLALKGGTAINLTVFYLPRLSVDIDLDFTGDFSREETKQRRDRITSVIERYMTAQGYVQKGKSKRTYILDSFVYSYTNAAGNADNIKVEINYSLRCHVLPEITAFSQTSEAFASFPIRTLNPIEIFGSKIVALSGRAAARDLYDLNNMILFGLFDESEFAMLRKCAVFYLAVAGDEGARDLAFGRVEDITSYKIKTDLIPMVRNAEFFDLPAAKQRVSSFISDNLTLQESEKEFLRRFAEGHYKPQILFNDPEIVKRIEHHPMAAWRIQHIRDEQDRGDR